jgi:hypothetical protein
LSAENANDRKKLDELANEKQKVNYWTVYVRH